MGFVFYVIQIEMFFFYVIVCIFCFTGKKIEYWYLYLTPEFIYKMLFEQIIVLSII